jgi:nucleotide-binding universal stress UspA family protein
MKIRPSGPFRSILFPSDFSLASEVVAEHAAGIAKTIGTKVWLVNVVPWLEDWRGSSESYFGPFSDSARLILEPERERTICERMKMLQELQQRKFGAVESECVVRTGGVADALVEFAAEKDVGMIMMPTRAASPGRRFLIGSTTAKVLYDARCAVWTSPHPRELGPFHPYRIIVLAMDYKNISTDLLARAAEVADRFGANLSVFTAIPGYGAPGHEAMQKVRQNIESALRNQIAQAKLKASIRVLEGEPAEVIGEVAGEIEDADLLVTGRGHLSDAQGHLHSHNFEIIWNAPCPVVTL